MSDTSLRDTHDGQPAAPQIGPILEGRDVRVQFGGVTALADVNVEIPRASIVGLLGPNGAGKSSLLGVLSGLLTPNKGIVRLEGHDVTLTPAHKRARLGMGRTFQHPELFETLSVRDHLVVAHRAKNARPRFWLDLFAAGSLRPPTPQETSDVDGLIELLALSPYADRMPVGLPLGVHRLIEIGRALASEPKVLLLDEPGSGLHVAERERLSQVLPDVAREKGTAMLLVEHDVDMVLKMSHSVYVLNFGVLIAHGTPSEIRRDPAVQAAYLGDLLGEDETS